jgi:G3E family GTPase
VKIANIASEDKTQRHFLLIGGFLGAGKTTLIGRLTRALEESGRQVALITNDQGEGLMDTASARQASGGSGNVAEITGGCFCCRLDELVESIKALDAATRPEVMIAEPVGSCTDLMATVLQPLAKIYRTPLTLAPLVVVLDARRAVSALGGRPTRRSFHRDVGYVYLKQLEEAEWLVVNKCDLLEQEDVADLTIRLSAKYPEKKLSFVSAKSGMGLDEFFAALLSRQSAPSRVMEVDYQRYAEGEALLGWVNLEAEVVLTDKPGPWLLGVAEEVSTALREHDHEVGHFKMSLSGEGKRWRVHQVMSGERPELHQETPDEQSGTENFQLLVNLRAEGDARTLRDFVLAAFQNQKEAHVKVLKEAAFQPGKPEPTHRIA